MKQEENKASKYGWIYSGMIWSALMILFMGVGEPLYNDEQITVESLLHEAVLWIPMGVLFALFNRYLAKRKARKKGE